VFPTWYVRWLAGKLRRGINLEIVVAKLGHASTLS